jgi:hypothetical protein
VVEARAMDTYVDQLLEQLSVAYVGRVHSPAGTDPPDAITPAARPTATPSTASVARDATTGTGEPGTRGDVA